MENHDAQKMEAVAIFGSADAVEARQNLTLAGLTLHQCPDGSLVRRPQDCKKTVDDLPNLQIAG